MKNNPKQASCCQNASPQKAHKALACPVNGKKGQTVSSKTLRHLIKKDRVHDVKDSGYYFCKTADCDTVYYHPESGQCFQKEDLKVRVGLKETEDPVWLCYCFEISKKMIETEVDKTGQSSFGIHLHSEVAIGNCDCETLSPSGRCCLGEVLSAEKEAQAKFAR